MILDYVAIKRGGGGKYVYTLKEWVLWFVQSSDWGGPVGLNTEESLMLRFLSLIIKTNAIYKDQTLARDSC